MPLNRENIASQLANYPDLLEIASQDPLFRLYLQSPGASPDILRQALDISQDPSGKTYQSYAQSLRGRPQPSPEVWRTLPTEIRQAYRTAQFQQSLTPEDIEALEKSPERRVAKQLALPALALGGSLGLSGAAALLGGPEWMPALAGVLRNLASFSSFDEALRYVQHKLNIPENLATEVLRLALAGSGASGVGALEAGARAAGGIMPLIRSAGAEAIKQLPRESAVSAGLVAGQRGAEAAGFGTTGQLIGSIFGGMAGGGAYGAIRAARGAVSRAAEAAKEATPTTPFAPKPKPKVSEVSPEVYWEGVKKGEYYLPEGTKVLIKTTHPPIPGEVVTGHHILGTPVYEVKYESVPGSSKLDRSVLLTPEFLEVPDIERVHRVLSLNDLVKTGKVTLQPGTKVRVPNLTEPAEVVGVRLNPDGKVGAYELKFADGKRGFHPISNISVHDPEDAIRRIQTGVQPKPETAEAKPETPKVVTGATIEFPVGTEVFVGSSRQPGVVEKYFADTGEYDVRLSALNKVQRFSGEFVVPAKKEEVELFHTIKEFLSNGRITYREGSKVRDLETGNRGAITKIQFHSGTGAPYYYVRFDKAKADVIRLPHQLEPATIHDAFDVGRGIVPSPKAPKAEPPAEPEVESIKLETEKKRPFKEGDGVIIVTKDSLIPGVIEKAPRRGKLTVVLSNGKRVTVDRKRVRRPAEPAEGGGGETPPGDSSTPQLKGGGGETPQSGGGTPPEGSPPPSPAPGGAQSPTTPRAEAPSRGERVAETTSPQYPEVEIEPPSIKAGQKSETSTPTFSTDVLDVKPTELGELNIRDEVAFRNPRDGATTTGRISNFVVSGKGPVVAALVKDDKGRTFVVAPDNLYGRVVRTDRPFVVSEQKPSPSVIDVTPSPPVSKKGPVGPVGELRQGFGTGDTIDLIKPGDRVLVGDPTKYVPGRIGGLYEGVVVKVRGQKFPPFVRKVTVDTPQGRMEFSRDQIHGVFISPSRVEQQAAVERAAESPGLNTARTVIKTPPKPVKGGVDISAGVPEIYRQEYATRALFLGPEHRTAEGRFVADLLNISRSGRFAEVQKSIAELSKDARYVEAKPDDLKLSMIVGYEKTGTTGDPVADRAVRTLKEKLDRVFDAFVKIDPEFAEKYIENYVPHLYDKPEEAIRIWREVQSRYKTGMGPTTSFLKDRYYETLAEAIEKGELKPKTLNIVDLLSTRLVQELELLSMYDVAKDLESRGLVAYSRADAPTGWVRMPEHLEYLFPGRKYAGHARPVYVPVGAYDVFETMFSKGLFSDSPRLREAMKGLLNGLYLMRAFKVGSSAFHVLFTGFGHVVMSGALAARRAAAGLIEGGHGIQKAKEAFGDLLDTVTTASLWRSISRGQRLIKAIEGGIPFTDEIQKDLDLVILGGGGFKSFVNPMISREIAMSAKLSEVWSEAFKTVLNTSPEWQKKVGAALAKSTIAATVETISAPVMRKWVPALKLGTFLHMAERILEDLGPTATREARIYHLNRLWDHLDSIMGQMVSNRLYWKRSTKDALSLAIMFPTWSVGSAMTLSHGLAGIGKAAKGLVTGKGLSLLKETEKYEASFILGTLLATTTIASAWNWMMTGEPPRQIQDKLFLRTGRMTERGEPEYYNLPTYLRDWLGLMWHPIKTIKGKGSVLLFLGESFAYSMDYLGRKLVPGGLWDFRNPDKLLPRWKEAMIGGREAVGLLPFLGQTVGEPISLSAIRRSVGAESLGELFSARSPLLREAKEHPFLLAANLLGIQSPPRGLVASPMESVLTTSIQEKVGSLRRTPEQYTIGVLRRRVAEKLRKGEKPDPRDVVKLHELGGIGAVTSAVRASRVHPLVSQFNMVPFEDAVRAYDVGTPEEKRLVAEAMWKKYINLLKSKNISDRRKAEAKQEMLRIVREDKDLWEKVLLGKIRQEVRQ